MLLVDNYLDVLTKKIREIVASVHRIPALYLILLVLDFGKAELFTDLC